MPLLKVVVAIAKFRAYGQVQVCVMLKRCHIRCGLCAQFAVEIPIGGKYGQSGRKINTERVAKVHMAPPSKGNVIKPN